MESAYYFFDNEAAYVDLIQSRLDIAAGTEVPHPRPEQFVRVVRVGGSEGLVTEMCRLTFFVWASDWPAAFDLASDVKQVALSRYEPGEFDLPVYRTTLNGGLTRAPDDDGNPVYQFTIEATIRGTSRKPGK